MSGHPDPGDHPYPHEGSSGCWSCGTSPAHGRHLCRSCYNRACYRSDPLPPRIYQPKRTCTSAGCIRPAYGLGLCRLHWKRKRRAETNWKSQSSEYNAWVGLKQRCLNPNNKQYADYGGRGITVAPEWVDSFDTFLAHVGLKPTPDHSLDRIDNDGNYEPGNVRWATWHVQKSNQRRRGVCKRGHDISPDSPNTEVLGNGARRCVTCARWRTQVYRAMRAGTAPPPAPSPDEMRAVYRPNNVTCRYGHDIREGSPNRGQVKGVNHPFCRICARASNNAWRQRRKEAV